MSMMRGLTRSDQLQIKAISSVPFDLGGFEMEMIVEKACEECGELIMKPAIIPINSSSHVKAANECDICKHLTDVPRMARFQWSLRLRSLVNRLCSHEELKELRLDPSKFINTTLNARLLAKGKPEVVLDTTTMPITLCEKVNIE